MRYVIAPSIEAARQWVWHTAYSFADVRKAMAFDRKSGWHVYEVELKGREIA